MELIIIVKALIGTPVTVPSSVPPTTGLGTSSLSLVLPCTLCVWVYTVQCSTIYTLYFVDLLTKTILKILMSKLESWSLGKSLLVRMAIISLHVIVKTPFHLLYNPLLIKNLSKFQNLCGGGKRDSYWGHYPLAPPRWLRPCFSSL